MEGDIVLNMVDHLDNNTVAFSRNDLRPWKLAVDGKDTLGVAQSGHIVRKDLQETSSKDQFEENLQYTWLI